MRISVIPYRDFDFFKNTHFNSEIFKFSNDIEYCKEFIGNLKPLRGRDIAEDLAGGFENALN